ncbi:hypothetical protein DI09_216p10, partial [Mitosporidium daphniae]
MIKKDIFTFLRRNLDASSKLQDMYKRASFLSTLAQLHKEITNLFGHISLDFSDSLHEDLVASSKDLLLQLKGSKQPTLEMNSGLAALFGLTIAILSSLMTTFEKIIELIDRNRLFISSQLDNIEAYFPCSQKLFVNYLPLSAAKFLCDQLSAHKDVFLEDPWALSDVVLLASEFDVRLTELFPLQLTHDSTESAKSRRFSILGHMTLASGEISQYMQKEILVPCSATNLRPNFPHIPASMLFSEAGDLLRAAESANRFIFLPVQRFIDLLDYLLFTYEPFGDVSLQGELVVSVIRLSGFSSLFTYIERLLSSGEVRGLQLFSLFGSLGQLLRLLEEEWPVSFPIGPWHMQGVAFRGNRDIDAILRDI